ncbi:hypothetical protein [Oryzifoliimicrobium ureilyticus]|uniref:hypothetical protein n=1 Tax=Oryzifoliimicrobium ureilyticus TaxID=3113724 RepID=UPI003075EE40
MAEFALDNKLKTLLTSLLLSFFTTIISCCYSSAAEVFWVSDPVKPGETAQVNGTDFERVSNVEVRRLDDNPDTATASTLFKTAQIIAKTENSLSFVLPNDFTPGIFDVKLKASNAYIAAFKLNAPDVYWPQGDRGNGIASPGGWLRVSGRNIAFSPKSTVKLKSQEGREITLNARDVDQWSASFPVPSNVSGSYTVSLWNGLGDKSTWTPFGTLVVAAPPATPPTTFNLYSNQPEKPNFDDAPRLNAAMQGLQKKGGGRLLLRAGVYHLNGPLTIPDGVSLVGEGPELTTLNWNDMDVPPDALVSGDKNVGLENLTINAQRHFHVIRFGVLDFERAPTGENILVKNVVVRAFAFGGRATMEDVIKRKQQMEDHFPGGAIGLFLGGKNIVVEGCDVLSSMRSFVLQRPRGAVVTGNAFRNGLGWYSLTQPDGVLFENNYLTSADLLGSGGGIAANAGFSARNVLMRGNKFDYMFGGDREAMTTDGPGGFYHGKLQDVKADSARLSDSNGYGWFEKKDWRGALLFVVNGRGLGLVAHVTSRDSDKIKLDRPLENIIDESSEVTVVQAQENELFVDNSFTDTGGVQAFGTSYKSIFFENKTLRSGGFSSTGLNYKHLQPVFYIQYLNNTLSAPIINKQSGIEINGNQFDGNTATLVKGIVIRNNRLMSGSSLRIVGLSTADRPSIRSVLIENNEIKNTDIGTIVRNGVEDVVIRGTVTENVKIPSRVN